MAHYVMDEKTGLVSLVHDHGYVEQLGTPEQVWPSAVPAQSVVDPLAVLTAKVDLLLSTKIKDGILTADMIQASALPEATKGELTAAVETVAIKT